MNNEVITIVVTEDNYAVSERKESKDQKRFLRKYTPRNGSRETTKASSCNCVLSSTALAQKVVNTNPRKDFVPLVYRFPKDYDLIYLLVIDKETGKNITIPSWKQGSIWGGRKFKAETMDPIAWKFYPCSVH